MTQGGKTPEGETETGQRDVPSDPPTVAPSASPEAGQAQDPAQLNQPSQSGESVAENVPSVRQEGDLASPPPPENRPPIQQPMPDPAGQIGNVAVAAAVADKIEELSSPGSAPSKDEVVVEETEARTVKMFLQKRLAIALAQFRKAIFWNAVSILVIIVLSLVKIFAGVNDDVFYSVIVTVTVCLLCTLLFKRGCLHKTLSDMCKDNESCRFWPAWCLLSNERDLVAENKPSLRVPANADMNTQFQHEVVDPLNLRPGDMPRILTVNQESLGSQSTDDSPKSPIAINVDVHGDVPSSPFSGGACGYTSPDSGS